MPKSKKYLFRITTVQTMTPYTKDLRDWDEFLKHIDFHNMADGWDKKYTERRTDGTLTHTLEKI